MDKSEIQAEINRLSRLLDSYKSSKSKAVNERDELEAIIGKINSKAKEIEDGLQKTLGNIENRLSFVNRKSRFPDMYRQGAREILLNTDSANAVTTTQTGALNAKAKFNELDEAISQYKTKIRQTENQIAELRRKLSEVSEP